MKRLEGKTAIVVGAGQTPGETIGNGRAAAILFAREGARVLLVDRRRESAEETLAVIEEEGGTAEVFAANVTDEGQVRAIPEACLRAFGRIDIVQNNVGIGRGDGAVHHLERETWETILGTNLTGTFLVCKHVLPVMREQGGGVITNISSVASTAATGLAAYKVSKAGVNALTQQLAMANARYGIRVNAVLPGLMDTPMAVAGTAQARGADIEQVRATRNAMVPLKGQMGSAWDTAYASLFLASDEAKFITGVLLPVDGGQSVKVG